MTEIIAYDNAKYDKKFKGDDKPTCDEKIRRPGGFKISLNNRKTYNIGDTEQ